MTDNIKLLNKEKLKQENLKQKIDRKVCNMRGALSKFETWFLVNSVVGVIFSIVSEVMFACTSHYFLKDGIISLFSISNRIKFIGISLFIIGIFLLPAIFLLVCCIFIRIVILYNEKLSKKKNSKIQEIIKEIEVCNKKIEEKRKKLLEEDKKESLKKINKLNLKNEYKKNSINSLNYFCELIGLASKLGDEEKFKLFIKKGDPLTWSCDGMSVDEKNKKISFLIDVILKLLSGKKSYERFEKLKNYIYSLLDKLEDKETSDEDKYNIIENIKNKFLQDGLLSSLEHFEESLNEIIRYLKKCFNYETKRMRAIIEDFLKKILEKFNNKDKERAFFKIVEILKSQRVSYMVYLFILKKIKKEKFFKEGVKAISKITEVDEETIKGNVSLNLTNLNFQFKSVKLSLKNNQ